MLNFRKVQIEDKSLIDSAFAGSSYMGCDNAFGTMFIWSRTYGLEISFNDGFLFRRYSEGKNQIRYAFPVGNGDIESALNLLVKQEGANSSPLCLVGLTENMISVIENIFPKKFEFVPVPEDYDYIYKSDNLALLRGRKFHDKRNHISSFKKLYNWSYEKVTENNLEDCKKVAVKWCKDHNCYDNETSGESCALQKTFDHFKELSFIGGLIKVEGVPVAFDIGERINEKIFAVHFEKADSSYKGAYPVINNEFVKNELSSYEYVNREEDLGIIGLKRAKLSYNPDIILKKFKAVAVY